MIMKKLSFLILFCFLMSCFALAQTMDTIPWNERRADLYYWGSNWVDSVAMKYPNSNSIFYYVAAYAPFGDAYIGRACVTPQPMRVIGIAAPVTIVVPNYPFILDTSVANRVPEYFQLYQQENDSIYFVNETRWDTTTPQDAFQIKLGKNSILTRPFYEAYFEKPEIVHDTFYVGGTTHNNMMYGYDGENNVAFTCNLHPTTSYCNFGIHYAFEYPEDPIVWSNPPYHIIRYFQTTDFLYTSPPLSQPLHDTTIFYIQYDTIQPGWHPFFAIFDTNFVPGVGTYDDSCVAPTGLHIEDVDMEGVTFAWNAGGGTMWELSVCPADMLPVDGMLLQTPINYLTVDSLEAGVWYKARVRTQCDTDVFGPWSNVVTFYYSENGDTVSCSKPTNLEVISTNVGKVVLQWNAGADAVSWVTEVGSAGVPVGSGTVAPAPIFFTVRNGLDTATWHWARVRAKCGADWYSDWTDTVMFYIPGDGSGGPDTNDTTTAVTLAEQYTYLMPNPAREEVTVMSSFRVKAVELYSADGKLLQHKEVNAVGTTLDLKGLPAGVYFVRVVTHAGVTTKRLIIE